MKRLFAILAVVVIVLPMATSAFADSDFEAAGPEQWPFVGYSARELYFEPNNFDPRATILGSVYEYMFWLWTPPDPIFGISSPAGDHPVDVWLWRPSTLGGGWGLDFIGPNPGEWWLWDFSSALRRQSWPTYASTDGFGFYYAKFMLPRNAAETWYPCGFPCRWECTGFDPIANAWEIHAPVEVVPVYRIPLADPNAIFWPWTYTLYWPNPTLNGWVWLWPDPGYFVLWAGETVHPLAAVPSEGVFDTFLSWVDAVDPDGIPGNGDEWWDFDPDGSGFVDDYIMHWEYAVMGYLWKTTDLEVEWPADWPQLCP
jgi:hypothetical protein